VKLGAFQSDCCHCGFPLWMNVGDRRQAVAVFIQSMRFAASVATKPVID
jgi:hypothetical protein